MKSLLFFVTHSYIFKKLGCGVLQEHSWKKYIPGINTPVYCINKKLWKLPLASARLGLKLWDHDFSLLHFFILHSLL